MDWLQILDGTEHANWSRSNTPSIREQEAAARELAWAGVLYWCTDGALAPVGTTGRR
jgi:hypothetical protein